MTKLTRTAFRESVFARDQQSCVICGSPAIDAHHLIERKLWDDGGYYLENGVSLCAEHHIQAETTELSLETLRGAARITKVIVPNGFDPNEPIDKWGNLILNNGRRMKGLLFDDPNVQKILGAAGMLERFTHWVKYPRTPHFGHSLGISSGDQMITNLEDLEGHEIVITEKLDGENISMYSDHIHARSIQSKNHETRDWVKQFHASIRHDIPDGWRICGENMYAQHSLRYTDLKSYFYGFSIWDDKNNALAWDDTLEWFELLGITPVPGLYRGFFRIKTIHYCTKNLDLEQCEGIVVRRTDVIPYSQFSTKVAKWVRANHVATSQNWMNQAPTKNLLRTP
jgi:hypothetical protein